MHGFAAGVQYFELQSAIFGQPVDRPAVSARDRHRCLENDLEEAMDILFITEQRGDFQQSLRQVIFG